MGTQIRKKIYQDETGELYGVLEEDGRFFIHSTLYDPKKLSVLKHYIDILTALENELVSKGIHKYYTIADSHEGFNFCRAMGFDTNFEVWDNVYEVMVKEI